MWNTLLVSVLFVWYASAVVSFVCVNDLCLRDILLLASLFAYPVVHGGKTGFSTAAAPQIWLAHTFPNMEELLKDYLEVMDGAHSQETTLPNYSAGPAINKRELGCCSSGMQRQKGEM